MYQPHIWSSSILDVWEKNNIEPSILSKTGRPVQCGCSAELKIWMKPKADVPQGICIGLECQPHCFHRRLRTFGFESGHHAPAFELANLHHGRTNQSLIKPVLSSRHGCCRLNTHVVIPVTRSSLNRVIHWAEIAAEGGISACRISHSCSDWACMTGNIAHRPRGLQE